MKKLKHISLNLIACLPIASCLATGVSCSHKKEIDFKQGVLDEFVGNDKLNIPGLVSVPRPGHYHDKIVPYLKQRVKDIAGLNDDQIIVDEATNICFDIPATKGYENKDCIILQGHMDMVVAGLTEEEAKTTPIEVVTEGNILHSKDYKTSIGADDGIGIASALTILKNHKNIKHGPLRFIFTADEDVGMIGASQVDRSWFRYNNDWIKWLINIDAENIEQVYRSCAGNVRLTYSKDYDVSAGGESELAHQLILKINGLKGGHSAMNIDGRANADRLAFELMYAILKKGNEVQLINHSHPKADGVDEKFSANQLISHCQLKFASDLTATRTNQILNEFIQICKNKYPSEDWDYIWNNSSVEEEASGTEFIKKENSVKLINLLGNSDINPEDQTLNGLYYGIFKKDETGRIIASGNIGPVSIGIDTTSTPKIKFECQSSCRSAIGSSESDDQYTINWLSSQYRACAETAQVLCKDGPIYYPWIKDDDNELVKMFVDGFKSLNVNANPFDTPGGVEPAWWTTKSGGSTTCTCVGASIDNSHSVSETLHIDTIEPLMKNVISVIEKLATKK